MNGPGLSGLNCSTPNNLVLDSGVLYFNIDETAFTHDPLTPIILRMLWLTLLWLGLPGAVLLLRLVRKPDTSGAVCAAVKGLQRIDGYTPTLQATLLRCRYPTGTIAGSTTGVAGGFNTLDLSLRLRLTIIYQCCILLR